MKAKKKLVNFQFNDFVGAVATAIDLFQGGALKMQKWLGLELLLVNVNVAAEMRKWVDRYECSNQLFLH